MLLMTPPSPTLYKMFITNVLPSFEVSFFSYNFPIMCCFSPEMFSQKFLQHSVYVSGFFPSCRMPFHSLIPFPLSLTPVSPFFCNHQMLTCSPSQNSYHVSLLGSLPSLPLVCDGQLRVREGKIGGVFFNSVWPHRETQRSEGARCVHL